MINEGVGDSFVSGKSCLKGYRCIHGISMFGNEYMSIYGVAMGEYDISMNDYDRYIGPTISMNLRLKGTETCKNVIIMTVSH